MIELLEKIVCQLYIKMISFLMLLFRWYYNREIYFEMIDQFFFVFLSSIKSNMVYTYREIFFFLSTVSTALTNEIFLQIGLSQDELSNWF